MKHNYVAKNMNKINKFSVHKDKKYEDQFKLSKEDEEDLNHPELYIKDKQVLENDS